MTTGKTVALTRRTFVGKVMSLLFNMLSRLVITFPPRSKRLLYLDLKSSVLMALLCMCVSEWERQGGSQPSGCPLLQSRGQRGRKKTRILLRGLWRGGYKGMGSVHKTLSCLEGERPVGPSDALSLNNSYTCTKYRLITELFALSWCSSHENCLVGSSVCRVIIWN